MIIMFGSIVSNAVTFSGSNIPYDSSFHLGLVNGPGTGINIGADIYYPLEGFSLGGDVEQLVTNSEFEQNINILKYGLAIKFVLNDDFFLTLHYGRSSFYLSKAINYRDGISGTEYSIDADTRGTGSYIAIGPNFRVGEYYVTPKVILNNITDGGQLLELDLNVGHKF
jgi:hypothetical protein